MISTKKTKLYFTFILIIIFSFQLISLNAVEGQVDSIPEIQEKLIQISDEERENLQNLFKIIQEIEAMEKEEDKVGKEIEVLYKEVDRLEKLILDQTSTYGKMKDDLKQVLKSYQRMGAGSYIKIILESDSLAALIRRINILRDITRNTGQLLNQLDDIKEKLSIEKSNLTSRLVLIEKKQKQLKETLSKKIQAKEDIETYLASMEDDRAYYQEYLNNIQLVWNELKPMFSEATIEFSRIIEEENIPLDTLKISLTISGIKGSINEMALNNIVRDYSNLPKIIFDFSPGKIKMTLPEENLTLSGTFVILEDNTLKFEVNEGSFYDMALEDSAIEELFDQGYMVLNLKPIIGSNKIRSVEIFEDHLELLIIPVLN